MLLLRRHVRQSIVIGKDETIELVVLNVGMGRVEIGVIAPRDVPVYRKEISPCTLAAKRGAAGLEKTPNAGKDL